MYLSLKDIQQKILRNQTSISEIANYYLNQTKNNQHLNAFVEVFEDEVKTAASKLETKIKEGKQGKLFGLLIAIKDNICFKDHSSTAGSKILEGFISGYNSTVVQRLIDEDAIIIGRTNCDEFGMGGSNENSTYGPVLNPLDNTKVPGGSSGGSAAAVASGCCLAALGSDTGGSVRQPAAFCGLYGLKPSYGRISRYGLIAYGDSLDHVGIIAKNEEDIAKILEVIAGKDDFDSTVSEKKVPAYSNFNSPIKKSKIGYFPELFHEKFMDKEIISKSLNEIDKLKQKGHEIEKLKFPYSNYIIPVYYTIVSAECASNLAKYDGFHIGKRVKRTKTNHELITKARTEGFGDEVKRKIMMGNFVLSTNHENHYFDKATAIRKNITVEFNKIFNQIDFLIMPTTPSTAFELQMDNKAQAIKKNQVLSQEKMLDLLNQDIFLLPANMAGFPSISVPLGKHSNGLPFGIQVCSKMFSENKLLGFVKRHF